MVERSLVGTRRFAYDEVWGLAAEDGRDGRRVCGGRGHGGRDGRLRGARRAFGCWGWGGRVERLRLDGPVGSEGGVVSEAQLLVVCGDGAALAGMYGEW